ncbi:type II toxin-antitoxin system VapC family toxin [Salarchaeum japonicum]|uniref:PIN domain-containing protein n=1 Tax=Salarchaeum japonicum TaxID=555573 RepID=A0AAV3SYS1_9EURY|nr:PIN domain-containing protein [Salarchaeum japonicum]
MVRAVVDANVLFADRSRRDAFHDRASESMDAVDQGDLPLVHVLSQNLMEALASIQKNTTWGRAVETFQYLEDSKNIELVHPTESDQADGQVIFIRERNLELADAVTAAYMNRVGIEYVYSFDDDFDRFDTITRLSTADNPYA